MNRKLLLVLTVFLAGTFASIQAQTVYFSGVGRALVTADEMSDEKNPASEQKASGGYTMFDLGIYGEPSDVLRASVILRVRNEFGGFFGDGASLEFRQLQLEGLIAKKVKYEIGDIYMSQTPYTIWNDQEIYNKYEAGIFQIRRDVVNYENFFIDNQWRIQGINTKTRINFSKGIESLGIQAFGGRVRASDLISVPDRYMYGGRLDLVQGDYFRIGGNLTGISDIAGTVADNEVEYDNLVATSDLAFTYDKSEKFKLELSGEFGMSTFKLTRTSPDTTADFDDFFYDFGLSGTYKPLGIKLGVAYRNVGFDFNSPMAQTRRINDVNNVALSTFPNYNDGTSVRPMTLYDRLTQETGLYNNTISTTLLPYYRQYNNIEPYGKATPNRKGLSINGAFDEKEDLVNLSFGVDLMSEVVSEGDSVTQELRSFTGIKGGFVFNLNKILGFEKAIALSYGARLENTTRGGTNTIDFKSTLLDFGLDVEVLKDLHVLGGMKMFSAEGNEYDSGRDQFNQITSFNNYTIESSQMIVGAGLRYNFGNAAYFSGQYNIVDYKDELDETNNFTLSQWFFLFNIQF